MGTILLSHGANLATLADLLRYLLVSQCKLFDIYLPAWHLALFYGQHKLAYRAFHRFDTLIWFVGNVELCVLRFCDQIAMNGGYGIQRNKIQLVEKVAQAGFCLFFYILSHAITESCLPIFLLSRKFGAARFLIQVRINFENWVRTLLVHVGS